MHALHALAVTVAVRDLERRVPGKALGCFDAAGLTGLAFKWLKSLGVAFCALVSTCADARAGSEVRAKVGQVDFLVGSVPLIVEGSLLALVVAKHRECATLASASDGHSFGAQASLCLEALMLPSHEVDGVAAQKHLLLGKSVLKELLGRH